jgi:hypothetical protein
MYKISPARILFGIITVLLILTAATTNSVFAVPLKPSQQENQQMMSQLFSGKNVKIGNMTLGLKPGVMVMPLLCMSFSGNLSGIPMMGGMMAKNMNQSGMMMGGGTGNQSMTGLGGLGEMVMRTGMIPSVCFSMSDAMLFRSMMHGGSMMNGMMMGGANMTAGSTMRSVK